jgi:hypothetical protein
MMREAVDQEGHDNDVEEESDERIDDDKRI